MLKPVLGGAVALLLATSTILWMLRPAGRPVEGDAAPDFALPDQDGQVRRLGDYAGRWLVLAFYPRDDTPRCTREVCSFRDGIAEFDAAGASVLGVSTDGVRAHADFSRRHGLPFPLLSDRDGRTAAAYGSLLRLGLARLARRHTFIIAPDGRIAARFNKVDPGRHAAEIGRALRAMQAPAVRRDPPGGEHGE